MARIFQFFALRSSAWTFAIAHLLDLTFTSSLLWLTDRYPNDSRSAFTAHAAFAAVKWHRRLFAALTFTFCVFPFTSHSALAAECKVLDPELQGFYEGGCKHGLAEGDGVARGTAQYQGEFHKGMKHGNGLKTWAWGDRYEGSFANDRRNGKGMYLWGTRSPWAGERYVGDYVADQREGFGTYYWPSGDRYDGVWKRDRRSGYSAMEERRQVAEAARASVLTNGAQVCSWGRVGIAYKILRVGRIETLEENAVQVRLIRLEGVPEALSGSSLQPGQLVNSAVTDWTPCS